MQSPITHEPDHEPAPPRSLDVHLTVFDGEAGRDCGALCVLTPDGLLCELPAHPAAGIAHYPPDQPIASVLEDLLTARYAVTELERQP